MKAKHLISSVVFVGGWLYINYQIYLGLTTGEFNPVGRGVSLVSYEASPVWFYISIGLTIFFSVICAALILRFLFSTINSKVKAYGGNFSINTFKAILRGFTK
ncbi:hypothetical protein [Aurantivibrio infirmus]